MVAGRIWRRSILGSRVPLATAASTNGFDRPAEAGEQADEEADGHGDGGNRQPDHQGDARPIDGASPHIAAELVGAEPVDLRGWS
jgi:hypothetical protein